ncbi:MAG: DUF5131 family protein [Phycisphaerales bacterium]|nr:DUF5131 family protein [Phycisphaerales bacterium]
MDLAGIDWVIVGGESGPGARPIKEQWVLDIKEQCTIQGIPFFFKHRCARFCLSGVGGWIQLGV